LRLGTVTFRDGAIVIGTGTLAAGKASVATASLLGGSHSITAAYSGDPSFKSSRTTAALAESGFSLAMVPISSRTSGLNRGRPS
jgi:hypothetical protein